MKPKYYLQFKKSPDILTRPIYPWDNTTEIKDKQLKMFKTLNRSLLQVTIQINDKTTVYDILVPKNYIFDGASIPFKLCKGNMKLLIPALFHDYVCEHKYVVNYNRKLANRLFYNLLISCHINKINAFYISLITGAFQLFRPWTCEESV